MDRCFVLTGKQNGELKGLVNREIIRLERVAPNRTDDIKMFREILEALKEGVPLP